MLPGNGVYLTRYFNGKSDERFSVRKSLDHIMKPGFLLKRADCCLDRIRHRIYRSSVN